MKLYDYWRSTAAYRVRIALMLKNIPFERIPVHLVKSGGEHLHDSYLSINPQGLLPALMLEDGEVLTQSVSIIEYLDALYPAPPLYPEAPIVAQKVRQITSLVTCDMHPLNNLRVLKQLRSQFSASDEAVQAWYHHWLHVGFTSLELMLDAQGPFALGDTLTAADVCIIPQVYNARRFEFDLSQFPRIVRTEQYCLTLPAFDAARPEAVRSGEE
jgi:maleylacetoacetate isomerase